MRGREITREIDKQTECDEELARFVKPSDPVTHLQSNVRAEFQTFSGNPEAQPLISQLEIAFTSLSSFLWRPMCDDEDLQQNKEKAISHEAMAVARAFERSLEGLPDEEREAKKAKMVEHVEEERQV